MCQSVIAGQFVAAAAMSGGNEAQPESFNMMNTRHSFGSQIRYGRELVKSGVSGLGNGRDAHLNGRLLSHVLGESARASLGLATLGAATGLLRYYLPARRRRLAQTIACGLIGGAFGFLAGFGWKTRELTESMTRSAAKQMGTVRDQHWLADNPIDYA